MASKELEREAPGQEDQADLRNIQDNIALAGVYAPTKTTEKKKRDWQLYLFFRVLKQSEQQRLERTLDRSACDDPKDFDPIVAYEGFAEIALSPGLGGAIQPDPLGAQAKDGACGGDISGPESFNLPSPSFRQWLRLAAGDTQGLVDPITSFEGMLPANPVGVEAMTVGGGAEEPTPTEPAAMPFQYLHEGIEGYKSAKASADRFTDDADRIEALGSSTVEAGLMAMLVHEVSRHWLVASDSNVGGVIAAERTQALDEAHVEAGESDRKIYDRASINVGFTHEGLAALQLDETTLRSFPESFRDGMAARAERLGDTGIHAPEHWYGELGSKRIHGFFTAGFEASGAGEKAWKRVRAAIHAFNTRDPAKAKMRADIRALFLPFGIEIMHIELGQAPYEIDGDAVKPILPRKEHFGYRDGISQPFIDLKKGADGALRSAPHSGTPSRNRTWTPLATGELYLGHPDEDGQLVQQPANALLRNDGTYLVFRKLEQDVVGFRDFIAGQRPDDKKAQDKLAAEMVGRWKNGASLVVAPEVEREGDQEQINDFLFAADDPDGSKCPLGAHIRRSNPRDIGGHNNVRRHRIMRRSMAYGGSLIGEDSIGDGHERGLLFVAANARIEMQFEVVQADWLNGGEFLGQAGLGKCPLTGNNSGKPSDRFLEAGRGVPVSGIPSFVRLRGGDYFFMPSKKALAAIADPTNRLPPDPGLTSNGHSFGDGVTKELFSEKRVSQMVRRIAFGGANAIGVKLPDKKANSTGNVFEDPIDGKPVIFVGKHKDVTKVMSSLPESSDTDVPYTAKHAQLAGKHMLKTRNTLVGTDWNKETHVERKILSSIADYAWRYGNARWHERLEGILKRSLRKTVLRIASKGHVDLVRDFAADTVYAVVSELFGTPGPAYLTELALALPFSEARATKVDMDWLERLNSEGSDNVGLDSFKIWSFLVGLNSFADLKRQKAVRDLGEQASAEALLHLDALTRRQRGAKRREVPETLLEAFVLSQEDMCAEHNLSVDQYYSYVRSLVFELTLSASSIIPAVFGSLMDAIFDFGIELGDIKQAADERDRQAGRDPISFQRFLVPLFYEISRLRPPQPIVTRLCEADAKHELPSGVEINKNEWVAALVAAANLDRDIFPMPTVFWPYLDSRPWPYPRAPGKGTSPRHLPNYLLFGVDMRNDSLPKERPTSHSPRTCWGRERIAVQTLVACLNAAATLPGLRRVAGPRGEAQKTLGFTSGLRGKFARFAP